MFVIDSVIMLKHISPYYIVLSRYTHCDFTIVDMYDCDFESNMCRWRSESQQWVWERSSAASGSTTTGAGPEDDASGSKTGNNCHQPA